MYFKENKHLYKKFLHKIYHIIDYDNYNPKESGFERQYKAKNNIYHKGLVNLSLNDDDIIIFSELDEIPDMIDIKNIISKLSTYFNIRPHWFNFNIDNYLGPWQMYSILLAKYKSIKKHMSTKTNLMELDNHNYPRISGWHFSYFLTPENVLKKLKACPHYNDAKDRYVLSKGLQYVKDKIKEGGELFGAASRKEFTCRMPKAKVPRLN